LVAEEEMKRSAWVGKEEVREKWGLHVAPTTTEKKG
jgi:hypothetical protein